MFYIYFFLAASAGATLRFFIDQNIRLDFFKAPWPISTLIVNLLGSFLIGALFVLLESKKITPHQHQIIGIAFLGSMTTFSSFTFQIFELITLKKYFLVSSYIFASIAFGVFCVFLGQKFAQKLI